MIHVSLLFMKLFLKWPWSTVATRKIPWTLHTVHCVHVFHPSDPPGNSTLIHSKGCYSVAKETQDMSVIGSVVSRQCETHTHNGGVANWWNSQVSSFVLLLSHIPDTKRISTANINDFWSSLQFSREQTKAVIHRLNMNHRLYLCLNWTLEQEEPESKIPCMCSRTWPIKPILILKLALYWHMWFHKSFPVGRRNPKFLACVQISRRQILKAQKRCSKF